MSNGDFDIRTSTDPHFGIIGTCRQLRDEGLHFFYSYSENQLELRVQMQHYTHETSIGLGTMPHQSLHLPPIRTLHVQINVGEYIGIKASVN
jgi:hypothetical protein